MADNIVQIAAGSDDFELLVRSLEVTGLVDTIADAEDITVFAPTDLGFANLAVALGYSGSRRNEDAVFDYIVAALGTLGDPVEVLTDVLLYHVVPGAQTAAQFDTQSDIGTLLEGATLNTAGRDIVDAEPDIANPTIIAANIEASNGIIQALNGVLVPLNIDGNGNGDQIFGTSDSELLLGSSVNDEMFGNGGFDRIVGRFSDDLIKGGGADDTLEGLRGNDTILGQAGDDVILGGPGDDVVNGGGGADTIRGQEGDDLLNGGSGYDDIIGDTGNDSLNGSFGNDVLRAGSGDDNAMGGTGNDVVYGGRGNDVVTGDDGGDTVFGGAGDDVLVASEGRNSLAGGRGEDLFIVGEVGVRTVITDFNENDDALRFDASAFADAEAVAAAATRASGGLRIDIGDGILFIDDASREQLTNGDIDLIFA